MREDRLLVLAEAHEIGRVHDLTSSAQVSVDRIADGLRAGASFDGRHLGIPGASAHVRECQSWLVEAARSTKAVREYRRQVTVHDGVCAPRQRTLPTRGVCRRRRLQSRSAISLSTRLKVIRSVLKLNLDDLDHIDRRGAVGQGEADAPGEGAELVAGEVLVAEEDDQVVRPSSSRSR